MQMFTVRAATLFTNHYVTDITWTVNRCFSPEVICFYSQVNQQLATDRRCVMRDDQVEDSP
jgi:hypothetical protein